MEEIVVFITENGRNVPCSTIEKIFKSAVFKMMREHEMLHQKLCKLMKISTCITYGVFFFKKKNMHMIYGGFTSEIGTYSRARLIIARLINKIFDPVHCLLRAGFKSFIYAIASIILSKFCPIEDREDIAMYEKCFLEEMEYLTPDSHSGNNVYRYKVSVFKLKGEKTARE